ncbi:PTS system transcriptional activator [Thermoanaerobacterium thermosaccharolyticum DSM 571]|uniref:PTS system transcriptional activator n=1 Tax=Thermoanaerobacterium thermosaccharolyticum (strain ATCC 7956 / DSM 571 / NCIMB 9385 / NCA 3814 / NCTC 13789 / WDCM 00135 / 2032) TaxID=580327 RepID=D9TTP1_THETC|nr:sigma-54-dependent transcriptional regulator [Thermoanaerobacterium thermosaccharolyticum]ADL69931.1 PTS system transcriptional activator [Thermoanaerobacterium thermosaccharolyticum DSM 571]
MDYKNNKQNLKREEKVYIKLKELTEALQINEIEGDLGFDAEYIGELLNISRSNTSRELNKLLRSGKVIKIKGKPVLYLDKIYFKEHYNFQITRSVFENRQDFMNILVKGGIVRKEALFNHEFDINKYKNPKKTSNKFADSILDNVIGAKSSLRDQVSKAKAAILYPPNGLHTLIIGPTGVGKSTFAEMMYKFAVQSKVFKEGSPFIVFNCADYAQNPQLLMSQLFGHVKGAFTGAEKEKRGLIEEADGGILFLDEIHRMPPEGQEMLFTLIDNGRYRKLGETDNVRSVKVLIIAATTENPHSALLHTFLRRIPMVIQLPSLDKRTLIERFLFIYQFFYEEYKRLKVPISLENDALKAIMLYDCPGNIGQLRSDIKLICARAFLDYIIEEGEIVKVSLSTLPQNVKEGLLKIHNLRDEIVFKEISNNGDILFDKNTNDVKDKLNISFLKSDYNADDDLYDFIMDNWKKFNKQGMSSENIRENIENQIQLYYKNYLYPVEQDADGVNRSVLFKFVDPYILNAVEYAFNGIKDSFNGVITQKVIYLLSLHIKTLLERLKMGIVILHPDRESIAKSYKVAYDAAKEVKTRLEEKLNVDIPEDEIAFLAMFLQALQYGKNNNKIGILVMAHGNSTASSIADVTNRLLGTDHVRALDMPLEEKPEVTLNKAINIIKEIDQGKGVLMLVDMGLLRTFSDMITEKTGIKTRTIEMVSTPIVLEATRKALTPDMDLDKLVDEIISLHPLLNSDNYFNEISDNTSNLSIYEKNLKDLLGQSLNFLNPDKVYPILKDVLNSILSEKNRKIEDEIWVKFLFHCACMIERAIRREYLPNSDLDLIKNNPNGSFTLIKKHFEAVENLFGIEIPDSEFAYVAEMIDTYIDTLSLRDLTHI